MQPTEKKIWFPAKKYGWGWGPPNCWQGWIVLVVWLALMIGAALFLADMNLGLFIACEMTLTILLVVVCWLKGETPRWRWGKN